MLWENIFTKGILTASSTATANGYFVANVADYKPWLTWWRPSRINNEEWIKVDLGYTSDTQGFRKPDTLIILDHNLKRSKAKVYIEYSDNDSSWTEATNFTPADNYLQFAKFTSASAHRYWRVRMTSTTTTFYGFPYIGQMYLGRRLDWTEGVQPGWDPYNETAEVIQPSSGKGIFLGANVKYIKKEFSLNWANTPGFDMSFFDGNGTTDICMDEWWKNFGRKAMPLVFSQEDVSYRPMWCRVKEGSSYSTPLANTFERRGLNIQLEAYVEEG